MRSLTTLAALSTSVLALGTAMGFSCPASDRVAATTGSTCGGSTMMTETMTASLDASSRNDIIDTAAAAGSFKTLAAALQAADLIDALKGDGPFTVFAPTDDAFAKLPKGTVQMLLKPENKGLLAAILTYHVVPGQVMAGDVITRTGATSLNGQRIDIAMDKGGVMVDNARVVKTDILCANGVIHVIDSVIMPSTDTLLDLAAKAGSFNTLAAAIDAAGLARTLSGKGPFTVFAPTDAAFAALPKGTVENLLKPENRDTLASILKLHVVPGRVMIADALKAETLQTAEGARLRFELRGGTITVNGAAIVDADLEASNGVVQVIDRVILPG
ncbi:MAG: fasciclin domain-containing protein [Phycisphaerales bacterium]|nr:fasciclin domain-containing protein [Phycisphaerales bacterium]